MRTCLMVVWLLLYANDVATAQMRNDPAYIDSLNHLYDEYQKTDLDAADSLVQLACKLAQKSGYEKGEADALSLMGTVQARRGNHKAAIENYFAALKIYEHNKALDETMECTATLVRLAGALNFERDYPRSLLYAQKAITLAHKKNYENALGIAYRVKGEVLRDQGRLDSSLYYFTAASAIFERQNNLMHLANMYVDIGVNYYYKGDYHQAIIYNKKFYALAKKLNLETDYAAGLHNIGEFYYLLKSYKESLQYLDSAQYYGEKFKQYSVLQDTYKVKGRLYTALDRADSASRYYERSMVMKDSITGDAYKKELASLQTELDVYRHETEKQILVKEKSIATLYRNLAVVGFVAVMGILGFVLLRQKLRIQTSIKQRLEDEVRQRTAEIVSQKALIEDANMKLQLSLNRARVDPHFVFNVLNSIQHLVIEKKPVEASDHLARLSRLARYILEKSSLDEVTLREEINMLRQYILLEQLRLDNKFEYIINNTLSEETMLPAMLIQPYVENAIVHGLAPAQQDGLKLTLSFLEEGQSMVVRIEDNGVGRKMMKRETGHQSIGSTLGRERLDILSRLEHACYELAIGDLHPENELAKGTQVTLRIPLHKKKLSA